MNPRCMYEADLRQGYREAQGKEAKAKVTYKRLASADDSSKETFEALQHWQSAAYHRVMLGNELEAWGFSL